MLDTTARAFGNQYSRMLDKLHSITYMEDTKASKAALKLHQNTSHSVGGALTSCIRISQPGFKLSVYLRDTPTKPILAARRPDLLA